MNAAGIALTLICIFVVMSQPRSWAALGIFAAVCYLTQGQQILVGGFHMTAIRIVLLAGLCRVLISGDFKRLEFNKIDGVVTLYPIVLLLVSTLRIGTSEQFIYQLGLSYDIILSYYAFRCLLRNLGEVEAFLHGLGFLILPLAISMLIESLSGRNLFAWMGGIEGLSIREGRLRCAGAFRSGITAGVFGATLLPMFAMMLQVGGHKLSAVVGILSGIAIVYTSNSSGPLMAMLGGSAALLLWPWREEMRRVRWGIVATLVGLHIVMKAPVWFLIAKISSITGGDGWYRSQLIEQFIRHFSDWWLLGTNDTGDWMPTGLYDPKTGTTSADLTNQYVASGVNGGIWSLLVYILIIGRCFQKLGNAAKVLRPELRNSEMLLWGLGAALFAHAFTIISVTYWDQMYVPWWGLLGIIASVSSEIIRPGPASEALDKIPETMLREVGASSSRAM